MRKSLKDDEMTEAAIDVDEESRQVIGKAGRYIAKCYLVYKGGECSPGTEIVLDDIDAEIFTRLGEVEPV